MVYSASGKAALYRDGNSDNNLRGAYVVEGDQISITSGHVNLLDLNLKRITISEPGIYSFRAIKQLFVGVNTSLGNKYLIYIWEKMNYHSSIIAHKGGVDRTDLYSGRFSPYDSAIVFADTLNFAFINQNNLKVQITIYDHSNKVVKNYSTSNDSISLPCKKTHWMVPGKFIWDVKSDSEIVKLPTCFYLPSKLEKQVFTNEMVLINATVESLPEEDRLNTLISILMLKHWIY